MHKHKHVIRTLFILLGLLLAIWGIYHVGASLTEQYPRTAAVSPVITHQNPPVPTIAALYDLTNQERVKAGLAPLALDDRLTASATAKCQDMVAKHYWQHIAPDGTRWDSFINAQIPSYYKAAENLSTNWHTSTGVVNGWMGSPPHRDAILTAQYDHVGYAICNDGDHQNMVVQHFIDL